MSLRSRLRSPMLLAFLGGLFFGGAAVGTASAVLLGSAVFRDIRPGSFYDDAVGELYAAGILKGYDDGMFHPNDPVTRGQLAVLFKRLRDEIRGVPMDLPSISSSSVSSQPVASSSSSSRSSRTSSSSSSVASANTTAGSFRLPSDTLSIPDVAPSISVTVQRVGGKRGVVTVAYVLGEGTAVPSTDYYATNGTLTFKDGEMSKTVTARIIKNTAATGDRTVILTISSPTGGATLLSPSRMTITLTHGSSGGSSSSNGSSTSSSSSAASANTVSFSAGGYGVLENGGSAVITVVRQGSSSSAATVEYATAPGTAKINTHYTSAAGTLSFAAGESSKTFTVPVVDNTSTDGNVQLTLQLKNPSGVALRVPSTATLTIVDDESAPTGSGSVKLDASKFTAKRSDGFAYVTISRAGGSVAGTVTATYDTMDDTARNGGDYNRVSGSVTFAAGETKKVISIPLIQQSGMGGEVYFSFRLLTVTGNAIMGSLTDATVTIQG